MFFTHWHEDHRGCQIPRCNANCTVPSSCVKFLSFPCSRNEMGTHFNSFGPNWFLFGPKLTELVVSHRFEPGTRYLTPNVGKISSMPIQVKNQTKTRTVRIQRPTNRDSFLILLELSESSCFFQTTRQYFGFRRNAHCQCPLQEAVFFN